MILENTSPEYVHELEAEVERLRAEQRESADNDVRAFASLQAQARREHERAEQAEARLAKVDRQITECEEFGIERFDPAVAELLRRIRAALAAAQPEEKP